MFLAAWIFGGDDIVAYSSRVLVLSETSALA
jgi:hypothetical protein